MDLLRYDDIPEPPTRPAMPDRWGVECTIRDGKLESHVPAGFLAAAANEQAVAYMRQIAVELRRLPYRYGYDPATAYTALVQTWDRARLPFRSLAFGRPTSGYDMVGLIPDAYYIHSSGYDDLHQLALRLPAWPERASRVVWRGSVTGQGPFAVPEDVPRIRLVLACRDLPDADVALTNVHETLRDHHAQFHGFLAAAGLLSPGWPMPEFARYKFTLDIDGHANAWGLLEKLILGCCVLKVASSLEQWYYPRLHAWEHYVPIAGDLSDLADRVQWCRDNDEQCRWIAANGMRLAGTLRHRPELPRSCMEFMTIATARA